jgi:cyclic beta-1,2-glucan synthetase
LGDPIIQSRNAGNLVIGFYPDARQASEALLLLRRRYFFRSASIAVTEKGDRHINGHPHILWSALLISAILATMPAWTGHLSWIVAALVAGGICGLERIFAFRFGLVLSGNVLKEYAPRVFPGETMILVQCASRDTRRLSALLQESEIGKPILFVIRPCISEFLDAKRKNRELLSADQLRQHAISCADSHRPGAPVKPRKSVFTLLDRWETIIEKVRGDLEEAVELNQSITPSAEWLLDNAYIIRNHIHDIRRNLPKRYYEILPTLAANFDEVSIRILDLAVKLADKTDGNVSSGTIHNFLRAYQDSQPLSIAELWAFPLMVRYALIEDLAYQALRVSRRQHDREWADFWAHRLLSAVGRCPDRVPAIFAEISAQTPVLPPHFVIHLMDQLAEEETIFSAAQKWLEARLESSFQEVIRREHARQSAKQLSIANDVTSLRCLAQLDWRENFEQLSLVEQILRQDAVYAGSDFATRDRCRRAVEGIARYSKSREIEVAERAIQCSAQSTSERIDHVAYFLIDHGRRLLESLFGCRLPFSERRLRWMLDHPNLVYFTGVSAGTVVVLDIALVLAGHSGIGFWALLGFAAAAFLPASEVSIQIFNYLMSRWIPPRFIPRMSFTEGIPDECRTLVVVPAMLLTPESIKGEVDKLEMRYLANPEPNLFFALLTDYADAPSKTMPGDQLLFDIALHGITDLNNRYGGGRFFLFHRNREWCETERSWIGWERKRGKLEDLNRFLNGEPRSGVENFLQIGDRGILRDVRYVLTLDADTKLPHQSALRLVEAMAHPLNHPVLSPDGRSVREGYGVIQPRVVASLPSTAVSHFSSIFANAKGTDPYAQAISDLYQDLFGEGIFIGKAIYDVRVFHKVLSGRFPEQTLLSHDLIEGNYLRVGFDSTVLLFEQFPSNYQTFGDRQHRWIRGDWQIANWLLPKVPDGNSRRESNPLSPVNRWKILDNLRRSLVPPACVLVLLGSWLIMPNSVIWNIFIALAIFIPAITPIPTRVREGVKGYFFIWHDQATEILRALATAALLPCQGWISVDAVARVWFRRIFSHRNLLQWESAQAAHWRSLHNRAELGSRIFAICIGTMLFAAVLAYRGFSVWLAAAPYLALWVLSPLIARWIDLPKGSKMERELTEAERLYVRKAARETWCYFDDFVDPQSNWLPPDNSQESLRVEVAYRTSPTNIGLWLLSAVAAHDLGYLTLDQLVERLSASFKSIARLEKSHGHLLNWYDLKTLEPLRPPYISSVDSGNLLASLWTLDQGLLELNSKPIIGHDSLEGLADAVSLLEAICNKEATIPSDTKSAISDLAQECKANCYGLKALWDRMHSIAEICNLPLEDLVSESRNCSKDPEVAREIEYWINKIAGAAESWVSILNRYFGWVPLMVEALSANQPPLQCSGLMHQLLEQTPLSLKSLTASFANPLRTIKQQLDGLAEDFSSRTAELSSEISTAQAHAIETSGTIHAILEQSRQLQEEMRLIHLYDADRKLFIIGHQVSEAAQNKSYYDLLASEARLTSLMAIAGGEVSPEHWQTLGRPFGLFSGHKLLYSWSGSMFEYLMPLIFTRSFENSLLHHACSEAVSIQIDYGRRRRVPWGISESAFSALDANQIYQYRAFGVPALGLKRDLGEDLVVAPYATALALMVDPHAAVQNMRKLDQAGAHGNRGFYEAIDYSRESHEGKRGVIVYAYMAHHQGMSLLAMDNLLQDNAMQKRFHGDLRIRAMEPLLYEGVPPSRDVSYLSPTEARLPSRLIAAPVESISGRFCSEKTPAPRTQLFSNGSYSCMITNSGGGYSRWRDYDLTRWRADPTRDHWGSYCYIRDLDTGEFWSTTYHPTDKSDPSYSVTYHLERAEFKRVYSGIETTTEIAVSPEDDVEVRQIVLVNRSGRRRRLDLTSYAELALAPHATDRAHPAFNKLFIQTEALTGKNALLASRRSGSDKGSGLWAGQVFASDFSSDIGFETSRERFLGRGQSLDLPLAMNGRLSNLADSGTDPIFSLRKEVWIEPGAKARLAVVTLAADTRDRAIQLIERYGDLAATDRVFEFAWTHAQLNLRFIRIQQDDVQRFQELAGRMLYPGAGFRAGSERLRRNMLGQSQLWAFGISGDLPICVVMISDPLDLGTVREVLQAHAFWHEQGLKSDLVILNSEAVGYDQPLQQQLIRLIQIHSVQTGIDRPGGAFLRSAEQLSGDDLTLILSAANVVLFASRGSLARQLNNPPEIGAYPPPMKPLALPLDDPGQEKPVPALVFHNGIGGFAPDGREYVICLNEAGRTPAPWINVLANPHFGSLVDETGQGLAWYGNSQMNRLTPWHNDPVTYDSSAGIYLRDEETGVVWTPSVAPVSGSESCEVRHGQGYSRVKRTSHGIEHDLHVFVPVDDDAGAPLRIQRLQLSNRTARKRQLTVTFYTEWVLGRDREETQLHVVTSWDSVAGAILARNAYNSEFSKCIAFAAVSPAAASYTADRTEFLGRNGSAANPAALERRSLSGRTGTGMDPCAALQVRIELAPGQRTEIAFLLGQAETIQYARSIIEEFSNFRRIDTAFLRTRNWWDQLLDTVQVNTPEKTADILLNRWLLYQTLSGRIWARSALYQSGGAYGFRDQLQDVMALVYARPGLARQHIIRAAGRQFLQGDVQHWWLPHSGAGVRTRCSDDLLWLPYVTAHYVQITGDRELLDERIQFLEGQTLKDNEQEVYSTPSISMTDGTLFEHCCRAIERGYRTGEHGLPLMGLCDWNDGFNRIGIEGKGESIWLAWFLMDVLKSFIQLCILKNESSLADLCESRIKHLQSALDLNGWDGEWYRRAYFDDGSPLGSHHNSECRIDSLAQSWAAISGGASRDRVNQALRAVDRQLIREHDKLILLFAPPFQDFEPNPGYIKSYPPGVRENGGQYTHAALWVAQAFARQGNGTRAVKLLRMLNPIELTQSPADVARYKCEPYALAADVYSLDGQVGRGGWTWYTGSSAWMYRIWIEEILGFQLRGKTLAINPTIPAEWPGFSLSYRFEDSLYRVTVFNPEHVGHGVTSVRLDGEQQHDDRIVLQNDGREHNIHIQMGREIFDTGYWIEGVDARNNLPPISIPRQDEGRRSSKQ